MLFDKYPKYKNGLPGHNWDIVNLEFKASNIRMIEDDILALLRYAKARIKENTPPYITESWLFSPNLAIFSDGEADLANRFYDKMTNSGSWILSVTAEYVYLFRKNSMQLLLSVLRELQNKEDNPENTDTLANRMAKKQMRRAANSKENEVLTLIADILEGSKTAGNISEFKMK